MTADFSQTNSISNFFTKGQPMAFGSGEVILGNQPDPDGVYYIKSGYVKTYTISDAGDEYLHIIYGKDEIFPLVWAYLGVVSRTIFYEAISDVLVWRLSREVFIDKIKSDLALSYALSMQLARQFNLYGQRINNLEYKKASERVAFRILFLAYRFGIKENGTLIIDAPITHEVLANSINLSRESVSRELEKFTAEHILKRVRHRLIIIDQTALAAKLSKDFLGFDIEL